VQTKKVLSITIQNDYFYIINIEGENDVKQTKGLPLNMDGIVDAGKLMSYKDKAGNYYLVTAPLWDSASTTFTGYIRIYQVINGTVTSKDYSTINYSQIGFR